MAFSSSVTKKSAVANMRLHMGTFTATSVDHGNVDTELSHVVEWFTPSPCGTLTSAATATTAVYTGTVPNTSPSTIPIRCTTGCTGTWMAFGY